jgi:predicted Zn-dependent protease
MARLESLKQAHPQDARVTVLEGEIAANAKDYEAAARAYEKAYRLSPSAATALRAYRAHNLAKDADPQALLEDWLGKHPGDESVRMVLAEAYLEAVKRPQAISQYEMLARAVRPSPMALNNLAWLYQEVRDPRARDVAKRAYDAAPSTAAIADTYGWILVEEGRIEEALPILKQASTAGAVPDITYHYAVALAKGGRKEEARAVITPIATEAEDSPAGTAARKLLAELEG